MRSTALPFLSKDFQVAPQLVAGSAVQAWVQFLPPNPTRWGFIVILNSGTTFVSVLTDPGFQSGFRLSTNGQSIQYHFRDWGGLVQVPWYYMDGNNPSLTVFEVLYRPFD